MAYIECKCASVPLDKTFKSYLVQARAILAFFSCLSGMHVHKSPIRMIPPRRTAFGPLPSSSHSPRPNLPSSLTQPYLRLHMSLASHSQRNSFSVYYNCPCSFSSHPQHGLS